MQTPLWGTSNANSFTQGKSENFKDLSIKNNKLKTKLKSKLKLGFQLFGAIHSDSSTHLLGPRGDQSFWILQRS